VLSPSKPSLLATACIAAAGAVLCLAIVDYENSVDDVPPVPTPCGQPGGLAVSTQGPVIPGDCEAGRTDGLVDRLNRADEIEADYERRLVIYSLAIVAIGVAYLLMRLRMLSEGEHRRAFTDLGIGAVLFLATVPALYWMQASGGREPFDPSIEAPLAAGGALVLIAGLGSIGTWSRPPGGLGEEASRLPVVVKAGAVAAAAAMLVSTIAAVSRSDCEEPRPEWLDGAFTVAFFLAAVAMLCGVLALFGRRWFTALLLLGIPLVWVFFAALATACLN
jgi:hypothetical protein